MSIHIIIDGYNLIRQSPTFSELDLADIQAGRDALIDTLADYKRIKRHRITVVFDGAGAPHGSLGRENVKGIAVRFSSPGESADTVIKRMAGREKERALIVSSDREIIRHAELHGAAAMASPAFEEKLVQAAYVTTKGADSASESSGWRPTTRKKGPRRRRSKKERRRRRKTGKL
jgi:predicted RNA-binding protein with PIN domain